MKSKFIATVASIALTVGVSGIAWAQNNPTEEKRPPAERMEKPAPANGGAEKRTGQAEPAVREENKAAQQEKRAEPRTGQAEPAEKRVEEKRTGQAEPAEKRVEEKRTGQAEPAEKRVDEKRTGQAEPAEKRVEEKRTGQAEPAEKRMDEKRTGQAEPAEKRMDEKRTGQAEPAEKRMDEKRAGQAAAAGERPHEVRVQGNIHISQERAVRITNELTRLGDPINVNFDIEVGRPVPEELVLTPLPPDIIAMAPEYRGYDYFYANDEIVFVQPTTHEIVGTIVTGNPVAVNDAPSLARPRPCPTE